jgi:hypothetical protein
MFVKILSRDPVPLIKKGKKYNLTKHVSLSLYTLSKRTTTTL